MDRFVIWLILRHESLALVSVLASFAIGFACFYDPGG